MDMQDLQGNLLFRGMDAGELKECLNALSGKTKRYAKDALLLHAGDPVNRQMTSALVFFCQNAYKINSVLEQIQH